MKDLTNLLEQLSLKLGVTTEYLWAALLKQALISGIQSIIYILFVILLGFILYPLHKKARSKDFYNSNDPLWAVGLPVVIICWFLSILLLFPVIGNGLTAFLNPTYWALDDILSNI